MASVHDGHRQRLRNRFLKNGLRDFEPHEALEFLLTFAIPRKDTNELAHRLIDEFGSYDKVFEADIQSLMDVEGIGESSAILLKAIFESFAYYEAQRNQKGFILGNTKAAIEYAESLFVGETVEVSYLLCFDSKLKLINCSEISRGSVKRTAVSIKRIVELASRNRAVSVILTHNHPNGTAMPSDDDIEATRLIYRALQMIDVDLNDHIVVGEKFGISMANSGVIQGIKDRFRY